MMPLRLLSVILFLLCLKDVSATDQNLVDEKTSIFEVITDALATSHLEIGETSKADFISLCRQINNHQIHYKSDSEIEVSEPVKNIPISAAPEGFDPPELPGSFKRRVIRATFDKKTFKLNQLCFYVTNLKQARPEDKANPS